MIEAGLMGVASWGYLMRRPGLRLGECGTIEGIVFAGMTAAVILASYILLEGRRARLFLNEVERAEKIFR